MDQYGPISIPEGQFIIMRPRDVTDRSCAGLSALIRRLHSRFDIANFVTTTVPERYRLQNEAVLSVRDQLEEEGDSDTSESSGGDETWAEELNYY